MLSNQSGRAQQGHQSEAKRFQRRVQVIRLSINSVRLGVREQGSLPTFFPVSGLTQLVVN